MLDAIIGLVILITLYRGWRRGLVRQILDLVGLVVAIVAAFAFSGPVADFLVDRVGIGPEISRILAPILLFTGVGIAAAFVERLLRNVTDLPVVGLTNHIGGLAVAAGFVALILALVVTVARVFPNGSNFVDDSRILSIVADEDAVAVQVLSALSIDDSLERIGALRDVFGDVRAVPVGRESFPIPVSEAADLTPDLGEADRLARNLNVRRQTAGAAPLVRSEGLAAIARDHAFEMATAGYLSRISPVHGSIRHRFDEAGLPWVRSQIAVGMGATTRAVEEAFADTGPVQRMMTNRQFDRVGIAVVNGPHGIVVVEVFGG